MYRILMFKGMRKMKKITAVILAVALSVLMLCGCNKSDGSSDNSSQSSTQASQTGSEGESSVSKYDLKFAELLNSFDYSSYESFAKNFTADSNEDYMKQSYEALKSGLLYRDQCCIGIDKGVYYYLFLATINEITQPSLVALEYNANEDRFYVKMNDETVQKGNEFMTPLICTECSGRGYTEESGEQHQCTNCYGLGVLFP